MTWYKDKIFWSIFGAAAAVKLAAFICICFFHPLGEAVFALPDSIGYVYPAQTLLQEGAFWEAVSVSPMLLRTPGYPLFLAAVQLITGNMTWGTALWQNILSLLMLLPVYLSANRLGGRTAARWAAFFCAASVLYFSMAFAVLTETLCAFLLAWFVFFILRFLQTPRAKDLCTAAILLAAAVYVRPAAYYFMPVAVVMLVCFCGTRLIRFPLLKVITAFIIPLGLTIGIWHGRNAVTAGVHGFTTVGAYNLYVWNEDYLARKYNLSLPQTREMMQAILPPGFAALPPAEQTRIYKTMAAPLIRESLLYKLSRAPLWAAKTLLGANYAHTARLLNMQNDAEHPSGVLPAGWKQSAPSILLFILCASQVFATVTLGITGIWILWKEKRTEAFFLTVYCLYFWGIGSVFYGAYARFRAPFEFALALGAGVAIAAWQHRRSLQADR